MSSLTLFNPPRKDSKPRDPSILRPKLLKSLKTKKFSPPLFKKWNSQSNLKSWWFPKRRFQAHMKLRRLQNFSIKLDHHSNNLQSKLLRLKRLKESRKWLSSRRKALRPSERLSSKIKPLRKWILLIKLSSLKLFPSQRLSKSPKMKMELQPLSQTKLMRSWRRALNSLQLSIPWRLLNLKLRQKQ